MTASNYLPFLLKLLIFVFIPGLFIYIFGFTLFTVGKFSHLTANRGLSIAWRWTKPKRNLKILDNSLTIAFILLCFSIVLSRRWMHYVFLKRKCDNLVWLETKLPLSNGKFRLYGSYIEDRWDEYDCLKFRDKSTLRRRGDR